MIDYAARCPEEYIYIEKGYPQAGDLWACLGEPTGFYGTFVTVSGELRIRPLDGALRELSVQGGLYSNLYRPRLLIVQMLIETIADLERLQRLLRPYNNRCRILHQGENK